LRVVTSWADALLRTLSLAPGVIRRARVGTKQRGPVDSSGTLAVVLSLAALLESLAARLDRLHGGTDGLLLRAVPVRGAGAPKVYGGFAYARLRDPAPATRSTPASRRNWRRTRSGTASGLRRPLALQARPRRRAQARVPHQLGPTGRRGPRPRQARAPGAVGGGAARPRRGTREALQGERPRVVLVTGVASAAVDDVRSQLREAEVALEVAGGGHPAAGGYGPPGGRGGARARRGRTRTPVRRGVSLITRPSLASARGPSGAVTSGAA